VSANGYAECHLRGAETPRSSHNLEALFCQRSNEHGSEDTLGADTLGEFPERGVVECQLISRPSGLLVGIGMELRGKLFERE
jgi:hypothetical protein